MPYDPTYPATNALIESAPLRGQFHGLKDLIDAVSGVTGAVVDAVNTLPPGNAAAVGVSVSGTELHLTFDLPRGDTGTDGMNGMSGSNGADGSPGPQGPPGEVSQNALDNAVAGVLAASSNNSNMVGTLGLSVSDPPTQAEVQGIASKLDELITALRR